MDKLFWPLIAVFGMLTFGIVSTIIIMDDIRCKSISHLKDEFEKL